jgi:hypothetical protein
MRNAMLLCKVPDSYGFGTMRAGITGTYVEIYTPSGGFRSYKVFYDRARRVYYAKDVIAGKGKHRDVVLPSHVWKSGSS